MNEGMSEQDTYGADVLAAYDVLSPDERRQAALWGISEMFGRYERAYEDGAIDDADTYLEKHRAAIESDGEWSDYAPASIDSLLTWFYSSEHPDLHALAQHALRYSADPWVRALHTLLDRLCGYELEVSQQ